ncbi:DNA-3-methyladenine glycosylase I [Celeribacter halophilus]|uniref:DNA-3-methyladenine glycosylase I n=1 Tax=Celeribacter halophilus TaxID=576117 RepID=A0A1I3MI07_9RHOB|nr:DNA-3-methyladenine glycosylase I [Celeribacter halophilus]PZX15377.1 DNA-3-methyladenine glycosylase I [Celeribacter halophilus]SFI96316.1 DNA-3-methyladenine glycosylase I [Celeribacter halophilus]
MDQLFTAEDGLNRCAWCARDPEYIRYHDEEWGYPVADDRRLFEKICLEGFQSGLSWWTILRKRENFRAAFKDFDFHTVAQFDQADIARLLQDKGIVRHRGKIAAVINNAARAREMEQEFGSLARFFWTYEGREEARHIEGVPATTETSKRLSKDLKKRGWKFVGPTTCYAFMQAMGLVNDHHPDCAHYAKAETAWAAFVPPR